MKEDKHMTHLGLSADELLEFSDGEIFSNYQDENEELRNDVFLRKSIQKSIEKAGCVTSEKSIDKTFQQSAEERAILKTVADMIAANNAALEQQLIQIGVLPKTEDQP